MDNGVGDPAMTARPFYFKLCDSAELVPCSWYEAGKLLADYEGRCLAHTLTKKGISVSTAFLVFDHNPFGDKPVLWNTIVRTPQGQERLMGRYSSLDEAREGHTRCVAFLELVS